MKNKKIILITEDEISLRNALHVKLINEGFNIIEAKDGEDGLVKSFKEHPDLILLDLDMPKMDAVMIHIWGPYCRRSVRSSLYYGITFSK